jgi:hypothetical protein
LAHGFAFVGFGCFRAIRRVMERTWAKGTLDMSYFAQTPCGQRRKLMIIDTPTQKSLISDNLYEGVFMTLIFWFLGFMIVGDLLAYLIGRFVEYEWGSYPSLVVFLALYFLSLWVAWLLSVRVTEPKKAAA